MILLDSANILAGQANLEVRAGQFGAFLLRITGLTGAAAPTAASWGMIRAYADGRPFYSVTFAATQTINDIDLGFCENTIGALGGNPVAVSAMILASRVGDGNVFDVGDDDNMVITVDLSGVSAANMASGTIALYGIPQEGTQIYMPGMFTNQPNIAASSREVIRLNYENVAAVYVVTTTNLDRINLVKDHQVQIDAESAALQALNNMEGRHEAAFAAGYRLNLHRSGSLSEALSDDVQVQVTTTAGGAATPNLVTLTLDYTPDKMQRSAVLVEAKTRARFSRKESSGKGRPVTVAKALTAGA